LRTSRAHGTKTYEVAGAMACARQSPRPAKSRRHQLPCFQSPLVAPKPRIELHSVIECPWRTAARLHGENTCQVRAIGCPLCPVTPVLARRLPDRKTLPDHTRRKHSTGNVLKQRRFAWITQAAVQPSWASLDVASQIFAHLCPTAALKPPPAR
jgi:hypothetical protein